MARTKPKKLSFTALERFRLCPWIYYLADVCRKPVTLYSQSLSLGGVLHQAVEAYHRQGPLFPMTEADLIAQYHQIWARNVPGFLFESAKEAQALLEEGEAMLRRFFKLEQERQPDQRPVFVEADFKIPLRPGYLLTGRIDRIDQSQTDGTYHVLDYKSSRRPVNTLPQPHESLQLGLYGLGAAAITGEAPKTIGFYYLAHGLVVQAPFTATLKESVLEAFHSLADALDTMAFAPDPEPDKCAACPYQSLCPVFHPEGEQPGPLAKD